jgi:TRAP-type C4-dicarboxylate transport system permease small subunit
MIRDLVASWSRRFSKVNIFLATLSGYVLFAMNGIVFLEVIMRYAFNRPTHWTNETACFMLLFISFIPAGFVLQKNEHIRVDFLIMRVGKKVRRWLEVFYGFLGAAYFAILLWQTCRLVAKAFEREWVSVEMMTPMGYPLLLLPLGCFILLVSSMFKSFDAILSE